VNGNVNKNQFKRIDQQSDATHKEMMLSTDMCLMYDANVAAAGCRGRDCPDFEGQGVPLLAQNHDCCAWVETSVLFDNDLYSQNEEFNYCGNTVTPGVMGRAGGAGRGACCKRGGTNEQDSSFGDCDFIRQNPEGPAFDAIIGFIKSDSLWVVTYVEAWGIAAENNQSGLTAIGSGLGIENFKKVMAEVEEEAGCEPNFNECFYVSFLEMFTCFFSSVGVAFNCIG
jgi:hypothetical protein